MENRVCEEKVLPPAGEGYAMAVGGDEGEGGGVDGDVGANQSD